MGAEDETGNHDQCKGRDVIQRKGDEAAAGILPIHGLLDQVDTVVLPAYQGQGLGRRLQEANQDSHDVFMSLKMSERNARIKTKLGGFALPPVSLMKLRLRSDRPSHRFESA